MWDFAGQQEYYNSHHNFISARTVFIVMWKISDGLEKGVKSLDFWFRSLAAHLVSPTANAGPQKGIYFSIIVVGTFLDSLPADDKDKRNRATQIDQLAAECGLKEVPYQYFEVSCSQSMENISIVQEAIEKTVLSHAYMGECLPMKYLSISKYLMNARDKLLATESEQPDTVKGRSVSNASVQSARVWSKNLPILNLRELVAEFGDESLVKRALSLLSLWGECLYFDTPGLESMVILDPKFLAQGILADLFTANISLSSMRKDGILKHENLLHIWARYQGDQSRDAFISMCKTFLVLLENLEVCFPCAEDHESPSDSKDFLQQRSIIPSLLPDTPFPQKTISICWPRDPPHNRPLQIERILKFSVIPSELVSRLLVQLHPHIQRDLVRKNEVVVVVKSMENSQARIHVDRPNNRFFVAIRGVELRECIKLLDLILECVRGVALKYRAAIWEEAIRSPFYTTGEILIKNITEDAKLPLEERALVCQETRLPLRAEKLLFRAGISETLPAQRGTWWNFSGSDFTAKEGLVNRLIAERKTPTDDLTVMDQQLYEKFELIFDHLIGDKSKVTKVYAIDNPRQGISFENYWRDLTEKHADNEELFRSEDWREQPSRSLRKRFLLNLAQKISKFRGQFNDGTRVGGLVFRCFRCLGVPFSFFFLNALTKTSSS